MCAVLRLSLMRHWTPKAHYCYTWGLVRAERPAEALLQLGNIERAALEQEPGCVANCSVMEGRALLLLEKTDDAIKSFRRAEREVQAEPSQLVDVDVLVNAKIGLVYAYTRLGKHQHAERPLSDVCKLCELATESTVMKIYHAMAASAIAQGYHVQAFACLIRRHKIALKTSRDVVFHAETLAEAHLARSCIPVKKKLPLDDMRRLLKIIRRTGKNGVVRNVARWLASHVRPLRRVRGKQHPEVVEQRHGRHLSARK